MFKPRPKQIEILKYTHGKMGISAVPGSGKTQTLSYLAANLLYEGKIDDDQEILVVTLVNSAVNNFSSRISSFLQDFGLLPGVGYRVRTLHGLAHDIVRERPDLVGLSNDFEIIDEREAQQIVDSYVESWVKRNPEITNRWGRSNEYNVNQKNSLFNWQKSLSSVCTSFIRTAKDLQLSPFDILEKIKKLKINDDLLNLGAEIYQEYQRALNYRSAVDFDDLIRLALLALQIDTDYLTRLRRQWPYILEDEAQDSSRLQEVILKTLSGENGNWVRVGDPNQAIFESFTTASPEFLKSFLQQTDVISRTLPNSGRSTFSIIKLANELIRWTNQMHPIEELRDSLTLPLIEPTPPYDPQPNPQDHPEKVVLYNKPQTSDQEITLVMKSLHKWLPENPESTIAILVPRNDRGAKIVERLQKENIPYIEILKTSLSTRNAADILSAIINFLENPNQTNRILSVFDLLNKKFFKLSKSNQEEIKKLFKSLVNWEDYLFPKPDHDWLENLQNKKFDLHKEVILTLISFRDYLSRWIKAADLPIHQIVITISQEIFADPTDLAIAHKLALMLEQFSKNHPEWMLPEFAGELTLIAKNKRKLSGFSEEETGFNPDLHQGKAVVTTYHKAKGLEWDRVYLLSANDYDFPSASIGDYFISEKPIYKENVNLEAESIHKLKALAKEKVEDLFLELGYATQQARIDYAAERIRLFFVGITRAKKELIITWNSGDTHHKDHKRANPALPFLALSAFWEQKNEN